MFVDNGFPSEIEEQYLSENCHALSRALLRYYSHGDIYLLIVREFLNGEIRKSLIHSYYFDRGIWSDIVGSYTTLDDMISLWNHYTPHSLVIVSISEVPGIDIFDFMNYPSQVDINILERINLVRALI